MGRGKKNQKDNKTTKRHTYSSDIKIQIGSCLHDRQKIQFYDRTSKHHQNDIQLNLTEGPPKDVIKKSLGDVGCLDDKKNSTQIDVALDNENNDIDRIDIDNVAKDKIVDAKKSTYAKRVSTFVSQNSTVTRNSIAVQAKGTEIGASSSAFDRNDSEFHARALVVKEISNHLITDSFAANRNCISFNKNSHAVKDISINIDSGYTAENINTKVTESVLLKQNTESSIIHKSRTFANRTSSPSRKRKEETKSKIAHEKTGTEIKREIGTVDEDISGTSSKRTRTEEKHDLSSRAVKEISINIDSGYTAENINTEVTENVLLKQNTESSIIHKSRTFANRTSSASRKRKEETKSKIAHEKTGTEIKREIGTVNEHIFGTSSKRTRTEEKDDLSTLLPPQNKVWSDVVSGKNVDVVNKESQNAIVGNPDKVQDSTFTEKWTKVFSKRQEALRKKRNVVADKPKTIQKGRRAYTIYDYLEKPGTKVDTQEELVTTYTIKYRTLSFLCLKCRANICDYEEIPFKFFQDGELSVMKLTVKNTFENVKLCTLFDNRFVQKNYNMFEVFWKQILKYVLEDKHTIDLHGMTRPIAQAAIEFAVTKESKYLKDIQGNGTGTYKDLKIITGRGVHSHDGPVLRKAVEEHLHTLNCAKVRSSIKNPGIFNVDIRLCV